jgi:hypothetical protein
MFIICYSQSQVFSVFVIHIPYLAGISTSICTRASMATLKGTGNTPLVFAREELNIRARHFECLALVFI